MADGPPTVTPLPELLPYQTRIVEFLKRHDPDIWNWFASARHRTSHADELKFDLLKSTYRVDHDSQPDLYRTAEQAAKQLGLSLPVTIYQAQGAMGMNASLAYLPDEAHIVLHGPLTTQLSQQELCGLFGHELTHFMIWQNWNGDLLVADEMLAALTHDTRAHAAHFASWRLLKLYNEIVCDRGALLVTQDMRSVISMLVKVQTGVQEIDPDRYLKQADEIFARGLTKSEGITHPEAYIRTRAIKLWAEQHSESNAAIAGMIEGGTDLNELDLLGQQAAADWTRRIIDLLLSRKWFQTDPVLAHARLYFEDYLPPSDLLTDPQLARDIRLESRFTRDYVCFVLLDFVSADRELDEPSLAAAMQIAEELRIKERFLELCRQELKLRKNQLEKVDDRKAAILQEADRSIAEAR